MSVADKRPTGTLPWPPNLSSTPTPQSRSSRTLLHPTSPNRMGHGPGEPAAESTGLLPTGSHHCAAFPQTHSRWVSSYGLALESLSNKNTSLLNVKASVRPPTNERGARRVFLQGWFGILSQSQTDVCKIWTGYTTVLRSCSCAQRATASWRRALLSSKGLLHLGTRV